MGSLSTAAEGGRRRARRERRAVRHRGIAPEDGEDAGFLNCNIDDVAVDRSQRRSDKSMWGITQALDLIDSAWGFASLDEDDEFTPRSTRTTSLFHPQTLALADFTTTRSSAISACPSASLQYDWTAPKAAPTLRSSEAADALELWAGAAGRLFAGEAEPLIFRGGVDPSTLLRRDPGCRHDDRRGRGRGRGHRPRGHRA